MILAACVRNEGSVSDMQKALGITEPMLKTFHAQSATVLNCVKILSRVWSVIIDGGWIDDQICWTLWYTTRDFTLHITLKHTH
jgi:hypothetical protein